MYKDEQLLGVAELMDLLCLGRRKVMEILHYPDCPVVPRLKKRSPWLVPYGAFMKWFYKVVQKGEWK